MKAETIKYIEHCAKDIRELLAERADLLAALKFIHTDLNSTLDYEAEIIVRAAIEEAQS